MQLKAKLDALPLVARSKLKRQQKPACYREGFLFAYQITPDHFGLNLLRVIPLARIELHRVKFIRQRSGERFAGLLGELLAHPFRCRYWPHPRMNTAAWQSTPYVIVLDSGRRVFVRLRAGLHYRLRAAVGEARAARVTGEEAALPD